MRYEDMQLTRICICFVSV